MLRRLFTRYYLKASALNDENILSVVKNKNFERVLDLGCCDGRWTKIISEAAGAKIVYGIELNNDSCEKAQKLGLNVIGQDLDTSWQVKDEYFDLVHANQVIEHVSNIDFFASEIYRVLKPGAIAIISTENGSSWHNILASIMGWQIFSSTNISARISGLGNPLALHKNEIGRNGWNHKVIFHYQGLLDFLKHHGFVLKMVLGSGYYPLPAIFGRLDQRHSHFLTIVIKKI